MLAPSHGFARGAETALSSQRMLTQLIVGNIEVLGNCLGSTSDLQHALRDFASGRLEVIVDSCFLASGAADFLNRTYNATNRFGKVVCHLDSL